MSTVLLATDSDNLAADIDASLAGDNCQVLRVVSGHDVLPTIQVKKPDIVLLDMQTGSMGGIAACIAIRQEEGAGRLERRPVGLLLDRYHDHLLAQQAQSDGWLLKPLDSLRIKKLFRTLSSGGQFFEHPK